MDIASLFAYHSFDSFIAFFVLLQGVLTDVNKVTAMLHRQGALAFWDYATAAPYTGVDMNPVVTTADRALVYKDAVFISTHKMVGGPGTPGILIAKKRIFSNAVPNAPGGGTVFYVTAKDHRYLSNREEREEGGTPDILGSIRAGIDDCHALFSLLLFKKFKCSCFPHCQYIRQGLRGSFNIELDSHILKKKSYSSPRK